MKHNGAKKISQKRKKKAHDLFVFQGYTFKETAKTTKINFTTLTAFSGQDKRQGRGTWGDQRKEYLKKKLKLLEKTRLKEDAKAEKKSHTIIETWREKIDSFYLTAQMKILKRASLLSETEKDPMRLKHSCETVNMAYDRVKPMLEGDVKDNETSRPQVTFTVEETHLADEILERINKKAQGDGSS